MRFGEFLASNRIKGLDEGYLDYARMVDVLESMEHGTSASLRRTSDDALRISTFAMPVSTKVSVFSSMARHARRAIAACAVAIAAVLAFFSHLVGGLWQALRCRGRRGDDASERGATDPLMDGIEDADAEYEQRLEAEFLERTRRETFQEFVCVMENELSRCNAFAAQRLREIEISADSLLKTTESLMTMEESALPKHHYIPSSPERRRSSQDRESRRNSKSECGNSGDNFDGGKSLTEYHSPRSVFPALLTHGETVEHAFKETHILILQLKQMTTVNLTGFLKAAKKCKKVTKQSVGANFHDETCCFPEPIDKLAEKITKSYAKFFTGGDIEKARAKLIIYKASMSPSLKVGFFIGFDTCLTVVLIWFVMFQPAKSECPYCIKALLEAIPLYRVVFLPVVFIWGWSVLVYMWRSYGINYLWILDIDPRTELGVHGGTSLAASMTSLCLGSLILFIATIRTGYSFLGIPLWCYPLGLLAVSLLICVAPQGMFYYKSRMWFFQTLGIIFQRVIAPFGPEVRFRENFVADVLTSMVAWIVDLEKTFEYYISGDAFSPGIASQGKSQFPTAHIITALPYWFRVQQCIRRYMDTQDHWHLVNCGKYLSSLSSIFLAAVGNYVSLDGTWTPGKVVWLVSLCAATLYCYWWDVCCDWGVISRKGMRKQLGFPNAKWFYFFAMATNFIGRLGWAFTITPHSVIPGLGKDSSKTIAATVEILRRCQWTLLRVEWEYIENPNKYRSVSQVPVLLTFESEKEQIHPMRATIITGANTILVVVVIIVAFVHYKATHHPL